VLHGIGDIDQAAIDLEGFDGAVEHLARRSDKRPPLHVFLIARLLTYEDHFGLLRPLAEDGLRRGLIEVAALAALDGFAQVAEVA
jgi:hypothetical protein